VAGGVQERDGGAGAGEDDVECAYVLRDAARLCVWWVVVGWLVDWLVGWLVGWCNVNE